MSTEFGVDSLSRVFRARSHRQTDRQTDTHADAIDYPTGHHRR